MYLHLRDLNDALSSLISISDQAFVPCCEAPWERCHLHWQIVTQTKTLTITINLTLTFTLLELHTICFGAKSEKVCVTPQHREFSMFHSQRLCHSCYRRTKTFQDLYFNGSTHQFLFVLFCFKRGMRKCIFPTFYCLHPWR